MLVFHAIDTNFIHSYHLKFDSSTVKMFRFYLRNFALFISKKRYNVESVDMYSVKCFILVGGVA